MCTFGITTDVHVHLHLWLLLIELSFLVPDHIVTPNNMLEKYQEKALAELESHCQQQATGTSRFPLLLMRLPALRIISPQIMEELFFAGLIGNVQIDSIIPYILRMEPTQYSVQFSSGTATTTP